MRKLLGITFLILAVSFCFADRLVLKDGTTHTGTLVNADSQTITFREDGALHHYDRSQVESLQLTSNDSNSEYHSGSNYNSGAYNPAPANRAESGPAARGRHSMELASGTQITVLTDQMINSDNASEGQTYPAEIADNVMNNSGQVIIPKGSQAQLVIRNLQQSGAVTGTNELALDLQSITVDGRRYDVSTQDVEQSGNQGLGKNKRTAEMVGGGTLLGTLIGAVAGGGKGAAIGAITGAAAGAGTQVLTRGKAVKVPAETRLSFQLDEPLYLHPAY